MVQLALVAQRAFARRLAGEIRGRIGRGKVAVVGGIPGVDVDAVGDARQLVAMVGDDRVEAEGVLGRLDLGGVGAADRGHPIGEDQAGLEEVELLIVLELHRVEQRPVEAGQLEIEVPERALVGDVVDREHAARGGQHIEEAAFEQRRDQSGLPVVRVHHVRDPAEVAGQGQHRLAEHAVAAGVVVVVVGRARPVDAIAVEQFGRGEEMDGQTIDDRGADVDAVVDAAGLDHHRVFAPADAELLSRLDRLAVAGDGDAHVLTKAAQRRGQRADHIGETASLDQWGHLAAGMEDPQGLVLGHGRTSLKDRRRPQPRPWSAAEAGRIAGPSWPAR